MISIIYILTLLSSLLFTLMVMYILGVILLDIFVIRINLKKYLREINDDE